MIQVTAFDDRKFIVEYKDFTNPPYYDPIIRYINKLLTFEQVKIIEIKKWDK